MSTHPPVSFLKLRKQDGSNRGNISAGCDEHSGVLVEKIALEVTYDQFVDNIIKKKWIHLQVTQLLPVVC